MKTAKIRHFETKKIESPQCLYIKLGRDGSFEEDCIEHRPSLRLSYREFNHKLCTSGKWDEVLRICRDKAKSEGAAKNHLKQLRYFYEAPESTLWYTFYKGKLFWCFADSKIELMDDGTKIRLAKNGWSSKDIYGNDLLISNLSGKLTRTQGFRQTICESKVRGYILNRINGLLSENAKKAQSALSEWTAPRNLDS